MMEKRIAIKVKFLGPTNFLGARVSYTCQNFARARRITAYSYDHATVFNQAVDELPFEITEFYETPTYYVVLVPHEKFDEVKAWFNWI